MILNPISVLYRGLGFWHIVPLTVIGLLVYISHRVLCSDINTEETPYRTPGGTLYADPTFADVWLSGGWRSALALVTPWVIWAGTADRDQAAACLILAVALFVAALNPWVLIPCARAIWAGVPVRIIRAVSGSLPQRANGSYPIFILRETLKRPLIAAALLIVTVPLAAAAIGVLTVWRSIFTVEALLIILMAWLFCWRSVSRRILKRAVKVIRLGSEPFTLYLRSFIDDDFRVLRDGLRYRVVFSDRMFNALRYKRFEEVLTGVVWPFGKLATLSRPGNTLPDIGALRVKTQSEESWQDTIMRFVDSADRVVMAVGFTSGLRWELAQFDPERLSKLILTFVPEHPESAVS